MHDKIDAAIVALQALKTDSEKFEDVGARLKSAETKLAATTKAQSEADTQLQKKMGLLDAERERARKANDEEMFEKTKELRTLNGQVHETTEQLKALRVEVQSARTEYDQILASMESLRKRLA